MPHHKLQRFAENLTFSNLFQVSYEMLQREGFPLRGKWSQYFHNDNPITLELGCGKGDYTVALARIHPDRNYIGVDIKGARIWRGAKTAFEEPLPNVAFIRTRIELIQQFFAPEEVSEIWITFPDPQPKKPLKRLTSQRFLSYYQEFLKHNATIHLKTDSQELHEYTRYEVIPQGGHHIDYATTDLYATAAESNPQTPCLAEAQLTQTFYERMFLAQGMPITYLKFHLAQHDSNNSEL